jgi:hypothetical protein
MGLVMSCCQRSDAALSSPTPRVEAEAAPVITIDIDADPGGQSGSAICANNLVDAFYESGKVLFERHRYGEALIDFTLCQREAQRTGVVRRGSAPSERLAGFMDRGRGSASPSTGSSSYRNLDVYIRTCEALVERDRLREELRAAPATLVVAPLSPLSCSSTPPASPAQGSPAMRLPSANGASSPLAVRHAATNSPTHLRRVPEQAASSTLSGLDRIVAARPEPDVMAGADRSVERRSSGTSTSASGSRPASAPGSRRSSADQLALAALTRAAIEASPRPDGGLM